MKLLATTLAVLLAVTGCDANDRQAPPLLGPNATALLAVEHLGAGDAAALRPISSGRMAEVLDEILELHRDRDRFCSALLAALEDDAARDRIESLQAARGRKLVWSAEGIELEGLIERDERRGRYRLAAIESTGERQARVMVLEKEAAGWRFIGFDEGPGLDTVIRIRNQFNQLRYAIDGLLRRFEDSPPQTFDASIRQMTEVLERLFGTS